MTAYATELRCAEALARQAGKKMIAARREGLSVDLKAKNDLVTNADRAIERFLIEELSSLFPADAFYGEEYGEREGADPTSTRTWLIDPIDGTTNFAMGVPLSCVSIALEVEGRSVVGVIYEPWRDELFSASQGQGAYLDGVPIYVSTQAVVEDALLVTGFPAQRTGNFETTLRQFGYMMARSRGVRRLGSAAIDLAYVAAGRLDAFWEYDLSPWDTAAGYLLVEEAGGKVTDMGGAPYDAHQKSVLATNGAIHDDLQRLLEEALP
jgi:myo-inositol-1(or 4)-monophosphatase